MRTLIYDLEISPALAWVYEMYDANVIKVERPAYIMCFAYKWDGEGGVRVVAQTDFPDFYEQCPYDDWEVVAKLHKLMDEADVVVAHNANKFDNKIASARFLLQGFDPPSPYKTVDTLTAARRYFRIGKNSLDYLGQALDIGEKSKTRHHELWYACVEGDKNAWQKMKRYCRQDVVLLQGLYDRIRPYITNHPNVALMENKEDGCPKCGASGMMQYRGYSYTNVGTYHRVQCLACGGWSRERTQDGPKPKYTNA